MMQYEVDSPLNLQLDNYYLINKGGVSYGAISQVGSSHVLQYLSAGYKKGVYHNKMK